MLIRELHLQNIRSYADEKITFPEGSVLLAGDIGSGKTTILLAAEFALFGIMRGQVSGSTLLRHGCGKGSVELKIHLHNKDMIIRRSLKRDNESITQDSGSITIDGVCHELTAIEMKAKILGLLGYPAELLNKSKNPIYRYTVFCPQEEMKRILEEDNETRIETLRKLFDIDKYKRIQENAKIILQELRLRKAALDAESKGTDTLEKESASLQEQLMRVKEDEQKMAQRLEASMKELRQAEETSRKAVESINKIMTIKQEAAALSARKRAKQETLSQREKQLNKIRLELASAGNITVPNREEIKTGIKETEQSISEIENAIKAKTARKTEFSVKKKNNLETQQKITVFDHCPLCLQQVSHEHKRKIKDESDKEMSSYDEQISAINKELSAEEGKLMQLKKRLELERKGQLEAETSFLKKKQLEQQQQQLSEFEKEASQLLSELDSMAKHELQLAASLVGSNMLEEEAEKADAEQRRIRTACQQLAVQHAKLGEQAKHAGEAIERMKKEILAKKEARIKLGKIQSFQYFIEEHFINLMSLMEKHVMTAVYHEFNNCFQNSFSMLVDGLATSLDDTFAPRIMQDGYETEFASLSGGERTACALAYRLALNKVVNNVVSTIHTKELLVLDEPTDGFSEEQVEKLRDVIEQMNIKQTIIVSHEQKIESFVQHILRIEKRDGRSTVA